MAFKRAVGTDKLEQLQPLAAKVPEITLMFWALKLLTTGMGEAMSDFLGDTSVPLAGVTGIFGMWLALRLQLRTREYRAPQYWFTVMMVAVFGTMAADALHDATSMPYPATTALYGAATAAVFWFWYRSEGTLSIHSINTRRRERFYWAAVFGTFALGTAAGDLTAFYLNLGLLVSIVLFASLISIPAFAWRRQLMNPIVAFWFAYVLTRPLGASFADWFGKPPSITGLGLGDGPVSAVALVIFVALVAYVTVARRDVQRAPYERQAGSHGAIQSLGAALESPVVQVARGED
ncbi:MAG TPA: hypothetical protein VL979_01795 [Solirubrobacteraceae bacterium]|nr:hypothetical protein [Solirubrobacteraceae bacterium]